MKQNTNKNNGGFIGYIQRTIVIKIVAIVMMTIGLLTLKVDPDGTGVLFISMIAVPMFFIDDKDDDNQEDEEDS